MSDAMAAAQCIDDLKEAGLDYDQARILVEFIVRSQEHLATKQDIRALEIRIDGLEARIDSLEARIDGLEARIDGLDVKIGSLAVDMKLFEARLTRQLYVFGFGIIGAMIAIMGLFLALQTQMQMPV